VGVYNAKRGAVRTVPRRELLRHMVRAPVRASVAFMNQTQHAEKQRGFTLAELIVVTGILVLITGVMLANNARFGGAILLENLAYDVALSVRKAQVYGIAVRRFGQTNFSAGYGMHFSIDTPVVYVLFADTSPPGTGDGIYQSSQGELVEEVTMQRGFHIADLCVTSPGSSTETCGLSRLDILFRRPEPDAFISANGISGVANPASLYERGRVILESPRGDRASVVVESTGQIAVQ